MYNKAEKIDGAWVNFLWVKKMSEIKARVDIPVAWAEQGRCPVCSTPKMQVQHKNGSPDQLRCMACGVAFEVEADGAHLHITQWPDSVAVPGGNVIEGWLTAVELHRLAQQPDSNPASSAPVQKDLPSKPHLPEDMIIRARKLRDLGNSPAQIRTILAQTEKDPERIRAAMEIARQIEQQEQIRQRKKIQVSMGIIGAIVVICVGAGVFLQRMVFSSPIGIAAPLQATLVPNLAKILNLSTPVVQRNVAPPGSNTSSTEGCPRNAAAAASMFGGQADKWSSPAKSNGWIMIDMSQGNTIFTPSGMTAAYLQLGSNVILVEVMGPATLNNVYYIAISCP